MRSFQTFILAAFTALFITTAAFAQQTGSLTGQVVDPAGAVLPGASITVVSSTGAEKVATANQTGTFTVNDLAPGKYTVRVSAPTFSAYENTEVTIAAGKREELTVMMAAAEITEQVDISVSNGVSTDPDNNAGATVLKGNDLEALPDDPDELEAALQALAGPGAGPNGGQIYIDGFTGGQLPPRDTIREIRINSNPFSAEYERLGYGRIEILTRPGSDKWRGSVFANFNDESLNSRNPFALNRAPSQMRAFGGNVSGPIQKGKSSFFLDVNSRDFDNNAVVNARILDSYLNPIAFSEEFAVPTRRFSMSPRLDYQINDNNTLVARYSFSRSNTKNQGINTTSLPSRAYNSSSFEHEFRLTETMIINPTTINETRFEYSFEKRDQEGDNSIPTINVPDAFVGGGAQIGHSFSRENSWEIINNTTTSFFDGKHGVKFGVRVRGLSITDRSESGFGGSYSFAGNLLAGLTALDQYRQAVTGTAIPTQFSITTGNPEQKVSRIDYGIFATDDWRVNPALTLSFGLRYENQTNISDNANFAPRFAFAYAPGATSGRASKTVIRGGLGWFYDRFSENLTLQALRFNGIEQVNLVVSANDPDPVRRAAAIALLSQARFSLDGVTNVPTGAQILAALPQSNTIRTIDPDLRVPITFQSAIGIERQLPSRTTLSAFYTFSRTSNVLRSRNINAPICPLQINCSGALRPDPSAGNIYQVEATGKSINNQLMINFNSNFSPRFSFGGNYRLGFQKSDADGAGSFPAYSYDLTDEWGTASGDVRHYFHMRANVNLPWGISASPFVIATSGRAFNIIRGQDLNGDLQFTERPTFGELAARCSSLDINASWCDVGGYDPNAIIPRNFGRGPATLTFNLNVRKTFGFGGDGSSSAAAAAAADPAAAWAE